MNQLFVFGDQTSLDVWLRACSYMGAGWTWVPQQRTFMHSSGARLVLVVLRSLHDVEHLRGQQFDLIVEHASAVARGFHAEWDQHVRAHLLRR